MKLIRRVNLTLQDGSTERIFEIDLCRTGSGKFVVNFRYGKKGASLKEGTKTKRSVPEAKARSIFARLVDDKKRKGYTEVGASRPASSSGSGGGARQVVTRAAGVDPKARAQAIVSRLQNRDGARWKLSRVAWRAGELAIAEATPHLINLIGSGDSMLDYSIAWALARCSDASGFQAILRKHGQDAVILHCASCKQKNRIPLHRFPVVARCGSCQTQLPARRDPLEAAADTISVLFPSAKKDEKVDRMAREMLRAWGGEARLSVERDALARLGATLGELAARGPAADFERALLGQIENGSPSDCAAIEWAYELDNEFTRGAVIAAARAAKLKPNTFKPLRHLFKRAELRRDGQVFGLLAYRMQKSRAMFTNRYVYAGGRWTRAQSELAKPNSTIAFGTATREYTMRRVWRTLQRCGDVGDVAGYVRLAVGVLLPVTDADGGQPRSTRRYDYRARSYQTTHWDSFHTWGAFNRILYANSHRYEFLSKTGTWRCVGGYTPGQPHPGGREEAYPGLWDKMPVGLLHLLAESRCGRVHEFAVRALRAPAHQEFLDELDTETLTILLGRPYEITAQLGYELAVKRYNPLDPDFDLVEAMASCPVEQARAQAYRWIEEERRAFLSKHGFIAGLVMSPFKDTRAFARKLLTSSAPQDPEALIARLVAQVLAFDTAIAGADVIVRDACQTLHAAFSRQLRSIGLDVVGDLLRHRLEAVQSFAGEILLGHDVRPRDLPEELLAAVMNSRHASVRAVGIRLFGELPDRTLLERKALVVALATSPLADVREAIRPVIQRLALTYPDFAGELSQLLLTALLGKEKHEGLHSYLLRLLKNELLPALRTVSKRVVLRLLKAQASHAQELGGILLGRYVDWRELTVVEVARLASHEILSVREASWKFYRENVPRLRADMDAALRILGATWDDSRAFAFEFFRQPIFTESDFTPAVIVSVCDSVREDVQAFGRELVGKYFNDGDAPEYLLKLSEHPSAELQLFASAYLEDYASDNRERLLSLQPYFLSVLSRVNRGRVAKARVFDFLLDEANKNRESAVLASKILDRQSVTMAIGDRASCIEAMLTIHRMYPEIALPLRVLPPEARARGRGAQRGAARGV